MPRLVSGDPSPPDLPPVARRTSGSGTSLPIGPGPAGHYRQYLTAHHSRSSRRSPDWTDATLAAAVSPARRTATASSMGRTPIPTALVVIIEKTSGRPSAAVT